MLIILRQAQDDKVQYIDEQMLARLSLLKPYPAFLNNFTEYSLLTIFGKVFEDAKEN